MPAARQRREIPVAGSPARDRQSQGLPPYLPHPQCLSAASRVLKKGGTGWDKWYTQNWRGLQRPTLENLV